MSDGSSGYGKRRSHPRVAASISVKVRVADGRTASAENIRNISLGGVFVEMSEPLAFGSEVQLEFSLPAGPRVIRCKGFIVWSTKTNPERAVGMQGVGVRLMDIGIADMRLLSEFIEQQLKASE